MTLIRSNAVAETAFDGITTCTVDKFLLAYICQNSENQSTGVTASYERREMGSSV